MSILSNTTVISNFASIGHIELLQKLFGTLYIPMEVYEEIRDGLDEGYLFYEAVIREIHPIVEGGWIHLTSVATEEEQRLFGEMPNKLHKGESACLAIARSRDWLLLTDDRAAGKEGRQRDIVISGTLGCLVLAVKGNLCTLQEANQWLAEMIQQGYHSPTTDLSTLLTS